MNKRSSRLELIDLGADHYTDTEYAGFILQLERIGRFLGGDKASFKTFNKLPFAPKSILDIGCGGGQFTIKLAKKYPLAQVVGIDTNPKAIEIAKMYLNKEKPSLNNVEFIVPSSIHLNYPTDHFDIVTSTLVCHHLTDDQLIEFFKEACRVAKRTVIMNDLHRHSLARASFAIAAPLFFRNRLIWHDGLLSIQRAFKKKDWCELLEAAGISLKRCSISWHWAFRWMVKINK
jgi:2-polyprenyl-3-methyl-5-hydroxy-6-metoxy-1,4-benzoquinol methylase